MKSLKTYTRGDQQVTTCPNCQVEIFYIKTARGKNLPVTLKTGKNHFDECSKPKIGTSSTAPRTYGTNLTALENRMMDLEKRMVALEEMVKKSAR